MPPALDVTGRRFGMLTAVGRETKDKHGAWMWRCRCDCGATPLVRAATLTAGRTRACASCAVSRAQTTHGMTGTPLYQRWRSMLGRTGNPNFADYRNYGGRGIGVCERWRIFEHFAEDMGPSFDPSLELDRIDVNGDYGPTNCRWATRVQQQRNRRNNHTVTFMGRTCTVQDWSELLGVKANTLIYRLRRGWPLERAMTRGVSTEALRAIANDPAPVSQEGGDT